MTSDGTAPDITAGAARLGIVGAGELATYTIAGLRRSGSENAIALSPRNRANADRLARLYDCSVVASNQAVVDAADIVVIALRDADAPQVCTSLVFRPDQLVIFASTGMTWREVAKRVAPAVTVRAMICAGAQVCEGPVSIYPDNAVARVLLGRIGRVIASPDETGFSAAAQSVVALSWLLALVDRLVHIDRSAGLDSDVALRLVTETMKAAATLASDNSEAQVSELVDEIAKKGTYSRAGLNELRRLGTFDDWSAARERVASAARERGL